jgi:CubicO group peptidase (beta-lactamase class C family)
MDAQEYNYFHPRFHPYYKGEKIHTIQSITKSISATLIGIAIDQGYIKGTNEKLFSFFDSYNIENPDARFRNIDLQDILTMRSGIEWHEGDRPLDSTNASLQLEMSKDWIRFTLSQPMDAEPGTHWAYNSGTSHLMSGIIYKTTGQSIDIYAEKKFIHTPRYHQLSLEE